MQQPLLVPDTPLANAPQPDAMAVAGARRDYTERPARAALLVEVSDATLDYDLTTKAELYAFRDPQPRPATLGATAYQVHTTHAAGESASPLGAPRTVIAVADLLP